MNKKHKLYSIAAIIAITALALTACDDKPEEPAVPNPVTITQTTTPQLAFAGKVTIKSNDKYTDAEWDDIVQKVVAAFNAAYEAATVPSQGRFSSVFANNANGHIVLVNNLGYNWEVRDGEFKTLYLKTSSIATADYSIAVANMNTQNPGVGNATPP
jgi:hypothetical protein